MAASTAENKLRIGDLIRFKTELRYAYVHMKEGMIGLVYKTNKSQTRFRVLLNNGTKGEVSLFDIDNGRLELLNR
jgi:hypothetical protein